MHILLVCVALISSDSSLLFQQEPMLPSQPKWCSSHSVVAITAKMDFVPCHYPMLYRTIIALAIFSIFCLLFLLKASFFFFLRLAPSDCCANNFFFFPLFLFGLRHRLNLIFFQIQVIISILYINFSCSKGNCKSRNQEEETKKKKKKRERERENPLLFFFFFWATYKTDIGLCIVPISGNKLYLRLYECMNTHCVV